jgi:monoamine oxidase
LEDTRRIGFADAWCLDRVTLEPAYGYVAQTHRYHHDNAGVRRSNEVSLLGTRILPRGNGSFEYYVDSKLTETHLIHGGAPEMAVRLAGRIGNALHLSSPVRLIRQSSAGVEVFSDRLTVDARRVMVATPPQRASLIEYDPALPAAQMQLLRRVLSGSVVRFITIYDEPFWRNDGLSGMSLAPDLPVPVALDQSPRSGNPGILSS